MEDGWVEYVDPASGHPYLYHAESGESRWVVAKPPEPPPGSPNGHANGASYAAAAPHDAAAEAEAAASSSSSSSSSSSEDDEEEEDDDDAASASAAASCGAPFTPFTAWPFGLPAGGSGGLATTQRLSPLSAW